MPVNRPVRERSPTMNFDDPEAASVVDDALTTITEMLDTDDLFTDDAMALARAVAVIGNLGLPPGVVTEVAELAVEIATNAAADDEDATAALRRVARRHRSPTRTGPRRLRNLWKTRNKDGSVGDLLCHLRLLEPVVTPDHRHYLIVHRHVLERLRPKVFARQMHECRWPA